MDNNNGFPKLNKDFLKKYTLSPKQLENQKTIASLYFILTLFSISFFGLLAINPTVSTITNLQKQYDDSRIIDESLTQKINDMEQLSVQYKKIQPSLDKVYAAIPVSSKTTYLMKQIQAIAQKNNLKLNTLEEGSTEIFPAQPETSGNYSFGFNLSFAGSKEDMYNFISNLINFDRVISISEINMSSSKSEEKQTFIISVKGTAYFDKL